MLLEPTSLKQMALSAEVLSSFLGYVVMDSEVISRRLFSMQGIFWVDKMLGSEAEPAPLISLIVRAFATGTAHRDRDQDQEIFIPSQANTLSAITISVADLCMELK